jgi:(1->4)-alpha-D-glucan 1-alpha-D-glucosylmutase
LNEVGGDPNLFGFTVSAFHGASADRAARWPHTMLATSTHDNKRAEDVRARIDVLSEMPAAWRLLLRRWSRLNRARKRTVDRAPAPSRNDEYLLYQTLLGTYPLEPFDDAGLAAYRERIERYMIKAIREAKVSSSWISVSEPYEAAVTEFVHQLLGRREGNMFLDDLASQSSSIAWFGMLNSLSMTAIKLASPGVPDIYLGTETWDFSLVDPDNRRPIDFVHRKRMLDGMVSYAGVESMTDAVRGMAAAPEDGRAKLWVIWRALEVRRTHPLLFEKGDYAPLVGSGMRADHVVAFARRHDDVGVIAIAGRLWASLGIEPRVLPVGAAVWGDTTIDAALLPDGAEPINALTGERVPVRAGRILIADAFANFPAALLLYKIAGAA